VIGPLVAPGRSACIRCVEHIDAERDPAWPWIMTQLRTSISARHGGAYDTVVGTAAAAFACLQILTWIDRQQSPSLQDAVAHLMGPEGIPQIHAVSPHPACGCTWAGAIAAPARPAPSPTRTMAG
jgi:bacteriocin biosynthesis cyclodehydratase domain-containing protein